MKSYIDKRIATNIFGSGGGGNLPATILDLQNNVDNLNMITSKSFNEYLWKIKTITANGGIVNISYKNGLYQKILLNEDSTIIFTDFPDMDFLGRLALEIINTILWNFGEIPDTSIGNSLIVIITTDSGNTIYGNLAGQEYS